MYFHVGTIARALNLTTRLLYAAPPTDSLEQFLAPGLKLREELCFVLLVSHDYPGNCPGKG
jgi:hypothetical protein